MHLHDPIRSRYILGNSLKPYLFPLFLLFYYHIIGGKKVKSTIKEVGGNIKSFADFSTGLELTFPRLAGVISNTKKAFVEATTKGEKFKAVLSGIKRNYG